MASDYQIDPTQSETATRFQSFANLAAAINVNRTAVNLGRATEIEILTNLTENYSFASWTTDATNSVLVYGLTQAVEWRRSSGYSATCNTAGRHVRVQFLTFNGVSSANALIGIDLGANGHGHGLIFKNYLSGSDTGSTRSRAVICDIIGTATLSYSLLYDNTCGIEYGRYSTFNLVNVTIVDCARNIRQINTGAAGGVTIKNVVSFGGTVTNWENISTTLAAARNNAGSSGGGTIPDTVGSTSITITSAVFVDYANNDFHITSTSLLRHTHASYPTGNNLHSGLTTDIDGQAVPTSYATDADRTDTGCDFYVLVVVGTRYYIGVNVSVAALTTNVKRDSDNADFTLNDLVAQDTLEIRSGAVVHFTDNGIAVFNYLKGVKIEILNGELWFENDLTTLGQTFFGIQGGKLLVGAQGKFYVRGALIELADLSGGAYSSVRDLDNGEWDGVWTVGSKDNLSEYGEPSVLFVGADAASAVPYFNESNGTTIGDLANDLTHGRVFRFNPANGNVTWPDHVPSTSMKVYCWNIMVHSQNGQTTPAGSFAFDTSAKGAVDWQKGYFTGNPNFVDANGCKVSDFGIVQPLTVDHCSGLEMKVYQGISQTNEQLGTNLIQNLSGQAAAGSFYGLMNGTGLKLKALRDCGFIKLAMEGFGSQTAGAYRIVVESTDDCDFGTVEVIDGGISFEGGISNNPRIRVLNHSNDQSGSNGNNAQHVVNGASTGTRGLRIDQVNLLANGQPTALDIFSLNNAGKFKAVDVNYDAVIRRVLFTESCFNVLVSDVQIARCTEQVWETPVPPTGRSSNIRIQGVRCSASPSSPPSFGEYSAEDIMFKNVVFEATNRYTGWTGSPTDLNFMELNEQNGGDGVLVLNFYQNTKGQFTFTGTAKSNNNDAVTLPAVSDRVEVEWPYDIEVGAASPYFKNATPTLVGTNTGNLTVEYSVNVNGAGYGSWKTLSGANLSGETITGTFRIRFRVTCATAAATNAIKQIILDANIDDDVNYPSALVDILLRNVVSGSRYSVFRGTPPVDGSRFTDADLIGTGVAAGGTITISNVPYTVDESITVRVRYSRRSGAPDYQMFEQIATLTELGADIFVSQILDLVAVDG